MFDVGPAFALLSLLAKSPSPSVELEAVGEIPTVVVTGTRSERRLSESAVATEVIGRREIDASGARTVGDLLEKHPGLEVLRTFGGQQVRMQGLDPEYVLVLIDGQRAIGRVGGGIDLSRFPWAPSSASRSSKGRALRSTARMRWPV